MPHENHRRHHKRDPKPNPEPNPEPVTTIVSVVYVTASKTFDGPVAGYSTLGSSDSSDSSNSVTSYYVQATIDGTAVSWLTTETLGAAAAASTIASTAATTTSADEETNTAVSSAALSTDASSLAIDPSATMDKSQTSVLVASNTFATSTATASKTAASESSSSTAAATTASSSSGGLSSGGVAGIIIGLVLLIGTLVSLLIYFCHRRKKREDRERALEDEKASEAHNGILAAPKRMPSSSTAPQLNKLRPLTQLSTNFGASGFPPATPRPNSPPQSKWERNMSEKQELNRENPFGTHAAAISNEQNKANPFGNHAATTNGAQALEGAAIGAAAMGHPSLSKDLPKPLDINKSTNGSNSPNSSMVSSSSGSATLIGAGQGGQVPVHRVMIDFAPSMADEVQLSANELVRLINTYDDGWVSLYSLKVCLMVV